MLFDLYGLAAAEQSAPYRRSLRSFLPSYQGCVDTMKEILCFPNPFVSTRKKNVKEWKHFEENCSVQNKSRCFKTDGERCEGYAFTYVNGMMNSFDDAVKSANWISSLIGGYAVEGVYNASHGLPTDLYECFLGAKLGYATAPTMLLLQKWEEMLTTDSNLRIIHVCHSQGAIHSELALKQLGKELRDRIHILAVGPGMIIDSNNCGSVTHLTSSRDFVGQRDLAGLKREAANVHIVPTHPADASLLFIHSIETETYKHATEVYLADILQEQKIGI